jgi:hypothetical protein
MRWWRNGPRSDTRTTTALPVLVLVTRKRVPKGRVLWAQVNLKRLKRSPLLVRMPWCSRPYHEARPRSTTLYEVAVTVDLILCVRWLRAAAGTDNPQISNK